MARTEMKNSSRAAAAPRTNGSNGRPVRRRRRMTPAQRFLRDHLPVIALAALPIMGLLVGIMLTAAVMNYRFDRQTRDYGRELRYASYTVKSGDTMWSIAVDMAALNPEFQDVRQYLNLLQKTNHNYGDYLQSGTTIMIPYYDSGDAAPMLSVYFKYNIADYEQWLDILEGYKK